jgi:cytochrome c-type protein NapB
MMEKSGQKFRKVCITFAWICVIAIGFILFSAATNWAKESEAAPPNTVSQTFDYNGAALFKDYDRTSRDYLKRKPTGRTLSDYYSRRQYPGSPPEIPHPLQAHGGKLQCLTCHAEGGWTQALKRITPVTPHPELLSCMQCHVKPVTDALFRATDWRSVHPPLLGRSFLPGAPLPIPHDLQMRGNCIPCHVGPGTVPVLRVEHPSRGNCRQCHLPNTLVEPFQR